MVGWLVVVSFVSVTMGIDTVVRPGFPLDVLFQRGFKLGAVGRLLCCRVLPNRLVERKRKRERKR